VLFMQLGYSKKQKCKHKSADCGAKYVMHSARTIHEQALSQAREDGDVLLGGLQNVGW